MDPRSQAQVPMRDEGQVEAPVGGQVESLPDGQVEPVNPKVDTDPARPDQAVELFRFETRSFDLVPNADELSSPR